MCYCGQEWKALATPSAGTGMLWRKEQQIDRVRSRTRRTRMCKRGGSPSSCGSYLSRCHSEVKCNNKSEDETPWLLYTDTNKAENSIFIGSEWFVGRKIQALPLLLKTTGTDNSKNAYTYCCDDPKIIRSAKSSIAWGCYVCGYYTFTLVFHHF